jgi:hypothetical protein
MHVSVRLRGETRRAIRVFRLFLIMISINAKRFARTFESFSQLPSGLIVEMDACLQGIGIIWYYRFPNGLEICLGYFACDLLSLAFGTDSSFQNVCEFFALTLGVIGLRNLSLPPGVSAQSGTVELRGDSMSALVWASEERYRSDLVCNSAVAYTLTCVSREIRPGKLTHLSSAENWRTDALSRASSFRRSPSVNDFVSCDPRPALDDIILRDPALELLRTKWIDIPHVDEWLALFDPRRDHGENDSDDEFLLFWKDLRSLLESP